MSDDWLIRSPEPETPLHQAQVDEPLPPSNQALLLPQSSEPEEANDAALLLPQSSEPEEANDAHAEETPALVASPEDLLPVGLRPEAIPEHALTSAQPEPLPPSAELPESASELQPAAQGPRCPYCREALHDVVSGHQDEDRAGERTVACADCQTPVHARCVQIHGRCVTNGCSGRSFAFVDEVPRPRIRGARIVRARAARRARAREAREPRQVPECPPDWWRRDAPLLVLGLIGILSLALFGDSLAEGGRQLGDLHASVVRGK